LSNGGGWSVFATVGGVAQITKNRIEIIPDKSAADNKNFVMAK